MDKIPDSISFSELRKIQAEKSKELDFSDPRISQDIGDLAFLFMVFIKQKLDGCYTHQQVFLLDVIVTELRRSYEKQLDSLIEQGASRQTIKTHAKIGSTLLLLEGMIDSLVEFFMKQAGSKSTIPSYRLVKSLDSSVKPHEIEQWISDLGRLGL